MALKVLVSVNPIVNNDFACRAILNSSGYNLLTIAVFYNPQVICIGGGISEEEWFIKLIREKFSDICENYFAGANPLTTEIRQCQYANDANILGATIHSLL